MSVEVKHRRGTTEQHASFTGAEGEVTVDTDKKTLVLHDGTTPGGIPLAREDQLGGGSGGNPIDTPPSTPHAMDDEFSGTSLDAKWSWLNQGTTVATVSNGKLSMNMIPSSDVNRHLVQTVPLGDFRMRAKVNLLCPLLNYHIFGISLYNSANGRSILFGKAVRNAFCGFHCCKLNSFTAWGSDPYVNNFYLPPQLYVYLEIKIIGTTISFSFSYDGDLWTTVFSEDVSVYLSAITHVGIGLYRNNTAAGDRYGLCEWFRVEELI